MRSKTSRRLPAGKLLVREIALVLLIALAIPAQQGGFVEGEVRDTSGGAISEAQVSIQNEFTGAREKLTTDGAGHYASSELSLGRYKVSVRDEGFRTVTAYDVAVTAGETRQASFVITLLPVTQEITVESAADNDDPTATGIAVRRDSSTAALPMNGRDLHGLYSFIPGAVLTPAAATDGGQFTVAGQRPNANTFRVDGISGNTGIGIAAVPGGFPGSTLPAMTVIGSTQGLASREEIQRVEMRSFDFAPEYGDRPGGQILIETRSGANELHGEAFGYLRPQAMDSADWFAQRYGTALDPASLNGYGASLGGACWRDKTFFFGAMEGANVQDRALQLMATPSVSARQSAPADYGPLLNAFPLPTGAPLTADVSETAVPLEESGRVRNYSIRIDQTLGSKARLFARAADVPSWSATRQLGTTHVSFGSQSATLGASLQLGAWIHDFRFNYSNARADSSWAAGTQEQNAAFAPILSVPVETSGITALSIAGIGQMRSGTGNVSQQRQWEGRYTFEKPLRSHDVRAGGDFIVLFNGPLYVAGPSTTSVVATSVADVLKGDPLGVTWSAGHLIGASGKIPIGAAFVQDTYKATPRLTILYGVRWELTHRTDVGYTTGLFFGSWQGWGTAFNPLGFTAAVNSEASDATAWPMRHNQIAPRFGLAYRAAHPDIVFRIGGGLFYDDALGSLMDPVNLSPLNTWQFVPGMNFSGEAGTSTPRREIFLPRVWEWRASAERSVGKNSLVSLAYVGSMGGRLLREEATLLQGSQILDRLDFASTGRSAYHGFEAQFRGDVTPRLYTLTSYTWAHSIDTASGESAVFLTGPGYGKATDRGSSSFDVRHNLSASAAWTPRLLKGFVLSASAGARTGFPFDVTAVDRSVGIGFANTDRADLIGGAPLWVSNPNTPGGRQVNPAAFQIATGGRLGTLGRNALTGPGVVRIDTSIRRQFRMRNAVLLELNVSAFNLFNHASFANPVSYLGNPLFGQATSMQDLMLGSGSPNGGLTPLFQAGGPRTAELGLKISF